LSTSHLMNCDHRGAVQRIHTCYFCRHNFACCFLFLCYLSACDLNNPALISSTCGGFWEILRRKGGVVTRPLVFLVLRVCLWVLGLWKNGKWSFTGQHWFFFQKNWDVVCLFLPPFVAADTDAHNSKSHNENNCRNNCSNPTSFHLCSLFLLSEFRLWITYRNLGRTPAKTKDNSHFF
jgi:hypothetical protein